METKFKIQLEVTNVLGVFKSEIREATEKEFDQLNEFVRQNLDYISFEDESGQELIFKRGLISNSLIKVLKLD